MPKQSLVLLLASSSIVGACGGTDDAARWTVPEPVDVRAGALEPAALTAPAISHAPDPTAAPRTPVDPALLAVVARHPQLAGWTLVPLLEIDTPSRALVIVWPAFTPDDELAVSAAPKGVVVARAPAPEPPRVLGEAFDATGLGADLAAAHLGERIFTVRDRREGADLAAFGERLATLPQLFAEAVEAHDHAAAVDHAVALGLLYDPWSGKDNVGRMLLLVTRGGLRVEHLATEAPVGDGALVHLGLAVPGEPEAEIELAARRATRPDRWVVAGPSP